MITPTADRPLAFALAERWMARQTQPPDEWIVADGGTTPVTCTRGQVHLHVPAPPGARNFATNVLRGLEAARGDVIVFWEDDDWYSARHLEQLLSQCRPGVQAVGDDQQTYYHVGLRRWRLFTNRGASLCQTACVRQVIPTLRAATQQCLRTGTYGIDGAFWRTLLTRRHDLRRTRTCIGLKGLPGQVGLGIGHRCAQQAGWTADPQGVQLRAWIGADADVYDALLAREAVPA